MVKARAQASLLAELVAARVFEMSVVGPAGVPLTAISNLKGSEFHPAVTTLIESIAMSHPGELPESLSSSTVLCRVADPEAMSNTTMYGVDALRTVVLSGVKLCAPGALVLPLRSATLVSGTVRAVLLAGFGFGLAV